MRCPRFTSFDRRRRYPLLAGIVYIVVASFVLATPSLQSAENAGPALDDHKAVLCSLEDSFSAIAEQAEPGVVSITAVQVKDLTGVGTGAEPEDYLRDLFGLPDSRSAETPKFRLPPGHPEIPVTANGSGTIIRRQGNNFYILTNYHVVENAYRVSVRLEDETILKGIVVGIDPVTDLAVVRISSPKLTDRNVVPLGDSDTVKVGSWALALGSPFGFEHSLTVGIVSALHRELDQGETSYPDLIQTDAAINKGNSGGPLLDVEGRVIGINTAIATPTGGSIGIGFAIPVNTAKALLDELIREGRIVRGWLGVGIQELTPVLQDYYGVKRGVLVASVEDRGPAARAGIASEDIIVSANGIETGGVAQLQRAVTAIEPGRTVDVKIVRGGKPQSLQVEVGLLPSTPSGRPAPAPALEGAGIEVRTLTGDLARELGMRGMRGVLVTGVLPGSPAEDAGLEEGDVCVSVNGRLMSSEKEFDQFLRETPPKGIIVLRVVRDGVPRIVGFRME
jgi:serine protease Do